MIPVMNDTRLSYIISNTPIGMLMDFSRTHKKINREALLPILVIFLLVSLLLSMLFHVTIVIEGAHTGLELWYESVLPSILPFMIITSLLLQQVKGNGICYLGLFCGLPVGANLVNQQINTGRLSLSSGNALLCICNITSPMFISGYILNQTLHHQVAGWKFFLVIYFPLLLYGSLHICKCRLFSNRPKTKHMKSKGTTPFSSDPLTDQKASASQRSFTQMPVEPKTFEDIIRHSLQVILMVGVYIMLFCILIHFLLNWLPSGMLLPKLVTCSLEITNGIHLLMQLPISFQQKTALIAGLTSFGGICSLLQTKSVLTEQGLSMLHYILIKLGMGGISYLLALLWL